VAEPQKHARPDLTYYHAEFGRMGLSMGPKILETLMGPRPLGWGKSEFLCGQTFP